MGGLDLEMELANHFGKAKYPKTGRDIQSVVHFRELAIKHLRLGARGRYSIAPSGTHRCCVPCRADCDALHSVL